MGLAVEVVVVEVVDRVWERGWEWVLGFGRERELWCMTRWVW